MGNNDKIETLSGKIIALQSEMEELLIAKRDYEKEKSCEDCKFYVRHWVPMYSEVSKQYYFVETKMGHCTFLGLKTRDIYDSCPGFTMKIKEPFDGKIIQASPESLWR